MKYGCYIVFTRPKLYSLLLAAFVLGVLTSGLIDLVVY